MLFLPKAVVSGPNNSLAVFKYIQVDQNVTYRDISIFGGIETSHELGTKYLRDAFPGSSKPILEMFILNFAKCEGCTDHFSTG